MFFRPASADASSDSVLLCDTAVWALHLPASGTCECGPISAKYAPEVDRLSSGLEAKSASVYK